MKYVTVTQAILDSGRSFLGGFSLRQANCFDITAKDWPRGSDGTQVVDWSFLVVGRVVPKTTVDRFLRLKDAHLTEPPEDFSEDPVKELPWDNYPLDR